MDLIKMTRELCKAMQQDERYQAFQAAREANDADEKLQGLICEFNLKRIALNNELTKEEKDTETISMLDIEVKDIYQQIMSNENMVMYNNYKIEFESVINEITGIINLCANGEDPDTCTVPQASGCGGGGCSSCKGCG